MKFSVGVPGIVASLQGKPGPTKMKLPRREGVLLSGCPDLNRGPHGPEPCALAGLSHTPKVKGIITSANAFDKPAYITAEIPLEK